MGIKEPAMNAVSRNVRAERLRVGLSQQALAKRTGLSIRYISRLETIPQNIRIDKLCLIAKALGITPSQLLEPRSPSLRKGAPSEVIEGIDAAIQLLRRLRSRVS